MLLRASPPSDTGTVFGPINVNAAAGVRCKTNDNTKWKRQTVANRGGGGDCETIAIVPGQVMVFR